MARRNGGFVGQDGLDAPDPPTDITPTKGDAQVSVAFTAPSDAGTSAITGFVVQVSTNDTAYNAGSNTGTSSPIVVSSLTNGTAATAKVWAINAYGTSAPSDASASFTPSDITSTSGYILGKVQGIEFWNITSTGNSADFGDMREVISGYPGNSAFSTNATQGLISGFAYDNAAGNTIDKLTLSSKGNTSDFGNLTQQSQSSSSSVANSTRAIHSIGYTASAAQSNSIEYMTFGSSGNATDFGNLSAASALGGGAGSSTRGIFFAINFNTVTDVIDYVTIGSAGNATDFGNLLRGKNGVGACSSTTRALCTGGNAGGGSSTSYMTDIEYVTIASAGNAIDFGDMTDGRRYTDSASSTIRATTAGGDDGQGTTNIIDYVTIATTGNASDFGDLLEIRNSVSCSSNCHGGLS